MENAISSINKQKSQPQEGLSKAELETAVDQYVSDFTGRFADIMKNYLASFRGEVTTLRKERQAEHQVSGYLHYRNSSLYWGNRAYNAAKAAGSQNPGMYYQYVQEHFQDSLKQTARTNIRRLENTRPFSQE